MKTEPAAAPLRPFQTTRWSVVLSAAQTSGTPEAAQRALTDLCRAYWRPIFAPICRRGHTPADAQDLTQDFFLMLLKGNLLSVANPARGRFRTILRIALEHFLTDKKSVAQCQKRGGTIEFVSWDDWLAEAPSQLSIYEQDPQTLSADRIFDVRWAASVVEQALRRLAEECETRGRLRMFSALREHLSGERVEISYAKLSAYLGVSESTIKRVLHRLRVRFRTILREEVARTVDEPAEIDDEIRYLCSALANVR